MTSKFGPERDKVLMLRFTEQRWKKLRDSIEEIHGVMTHPEGPEENTLRVYQLELGLRDLEDLQDLIADWNILRHFISSALGKTCPWDNPHLEAWAKNLTANEPEPTS